MDEKITTTVAPTIFPYYQATPIGLVTWNHKVAVEPFEDMSVKTTARGGGVVKVGVVETKVTMTKLKVVFPSQDGKFWLGMEVMVKSSEFAQVYAKNVYEHDGKKFILLPESAIEAVIYSYG